MICRIWHGRTSRAKADAYASFLVQRAIPDYHSVKGNIDVAIRAFAGDDLLKAKYYAEDRDFLLEFEPAVQHYEVAAIQSAA